MDKAHDSNLPVKDAISYAAPAAGTWFYYIPMWSILPGVYGKFFGLPLTSIAVVILSARIFDGFVDTTVGYLSDWHRSKGGSRKPWIVVGALGSIVCCYFLFRPVTPLTTGYYLTWSVLYFLTFALSEIPHLAWGSELTMDYQQRTKVFGVRSIAVRIGMIIFYLVPMVSTNGLQEYTPGVLSEAFIAGAVFVLIGLTIMMISAPQGRTLLSHGADSLEELKNSLVKNRPLQLYLLTFGLIGTCYGMWFGLVYIYIDTYLMDGSKLALMLLIANIASLASTPIWVRLVKKTSKTATWAISVGLFICQLFGYLLLAPGQSWWMPLILVSVANLVFCANDVAALAVLGDIVDYAKMKFNRDRGTTYFGLFILTFKVSLGIGGGVAVGAAGLFGFNPAEATHSAASILGLKIAFVGLPVIMATAGLLLIPRLPISKRRHEIIRKRVQRREERAKQRSDGDVSLLPNMAPIE